MFFQIGDFLSPVLIGGMTAAAVAGVVSPGSSMLLGMLIGMVLGLAVQIVGALFLMPLFGAFEVMVPAMLSGMAAGVLTGMLAASGVVGSPGVIGAGVILGAGVYGFVWCRNRALRGRVL